jgi:hypothetical protein
VLTAQLEESFPKVERATAIVKFLQKHVEDDISKRYSNRPVNLIGDINSI